MDEVPGPWWLSLVYGLGAVVYVTYNFFTC